MPVCQIQGALRHIGRAQYDPLIKGKRKLQCPFSFDHIMVSIEQIKPVLPVQPHENIKDVVMDLDDRFHAAVFPEFVAVAKFNVGKPSLTIVL